MWVSLAIAKGRGRTGYQHTYVPVCQVDAPQCGWGEEPRVREGSHSICLSVQAPWPSGLQGRPRGEKQGRRAHRPALPEVHRSPAVGCVCPSAHFATFAVLNHTHPHVRTETITEASALRKNSRAGVRVGLGPALLGSGSEPCDLGPFPCSMCLGLHVHDTKLIIVPTSWGDREGYCGKSRNSAYCRVRLNTRWLFLSPFFQTGLKANAWRVIRRQVLLWEPLEASDLHHFMKLSQHLVPG